MTPGLVQNCPLPKQIESPNFVVKSSRDNAPGKRIIGLMLPISAKTGIGTGRCCARS